MEEETKNFWRENFGEKSRIKWEKFSEKFSQLFQTTLGIQKQDSEKMVLKMKARFQSQNEKIIPDNLVVLLNGSSLGSFIEKEYKKYSWFK